MTSTAPAYLRFRWLVLGLALFYWLELFRRALGSGFGWQFKYLTIWALTLSLVSAFVMLRHAQGRARPPFVLASVTAIFNALVLLLYWRLYFTDPALVNGSGEIVAWREYYLHGLGPVLQMVDAVFLLGAFRRPFATLLGTLVGILAYILWIEALVGPLNATPVGKVTSGMPYPFLNDMVFADRAGFYLTTTMTGVIFILLGWALTWLRGRVIAARGGYPA